MCLASRTDAAPTQPMSPLQVLLTTVRFLCAIMARILLKLTGLHLALRHLLRVCPFSRSHSLQSCLSRQSQSMSTLMLCSFSTQPSLVLYLLSSLLVKACELSTRAYPTPSRAIATSTSAVCTPILTMRHLLRTLLDLERLKPPRPSSILPLVLARGKYDTPFSYIAHC